MELPYLADGSSRYHRLSPPSFLSLYPSSLPAPWLSTRTLSAVMRWWRMPSLKSPFSTARATPSRACSRYEVTTRTKIFSKNNAFQSFNRTRATEKRHAFPARLNGHRRTEQHMSTPQGSCVCLSLVRALSTSAAPVISMVTLRWGSGLSYKE